jgi:hypothetical protein
MHQTSNMHPSKQEFHMGNATAREPENWKKEGEGRAFSCDSSPPFFMRACVLERSYRENALPPDSYIRRLVNRYNCSITPTRKNNRRRVQLWHPNESNYRRIYASN